MRLGITAALCVQLIIGPLSSVSALAQISVTARPQTLPERSTTNFDAALRCMDELLGRSQYAYANKIYARGLIEGAATGSITRDMIVASLGRMSEKSRVFRISVDPTPEALGAMGPNDLVVGGSITAWDKDAGGKAPEAGISVGPLNFGLRKRKIDSILSLTLFFQDTRGEVMPLTTQALSMSLKTRSTGGDLSGNIGGIGGYVGMEFAGGDAPLQAVRALVDLALIQAVGAWAQIPYQRCLTVPQSDPSAIQTARKAYDRMTTAQQVAAIAAELARRSIYTGPAVDTVTPALRRAISDFQAQQQLPALGMPSFETYYALLGDSFGAPAAPAEPPIDIAGNLNPLGLRVAPYGPNFVATPSFSIIEQGLRASFAVTTLHDANIACFYSDADGNTTKVYPTAQRPAERLPKGQTLVIPGPGDIFTIEPSVIDESESLVCFGTAQPLQARLPAILQPPLRPNAPALPVDGPVKLIELMRGAGIPGLSMHSVDFRAACINPKTKEYVFACK